MTEGLRELIERWRERADDVPHVTPEMPTQEWMLRLCADELEAALAEAGRQEGKECPAAHHVRVPQGLAVWVQWMDDERVVGAHMVLPRDRA